MLLGDDCCDGGTCFSRITINYLAFTIFIFTTVCVLYFLKPITVYIENRLIMFDTRRCDRQAQRTITRHTHTERTMLVRLFITSEKAVIEIFNYYYY